MSFALSTFLLVLLYAACGIAAGMVQRSLGLISIAHAAVLGCGAYAYAMSTTSGVSVGYGALAAMAAGIAVGVPLTAVAGRTRGETYSLFTFGVQIVWLGLVMNLDVVGGVLGISGIPGPDTLSLVSAGGALALIAAWLTIRLDGTALATAYAIMARETELARAFGLPIYLLLTLQGVIYGAILGLSGAILAASTTIIVPSLFTVGISVSILAIAFFAVAKGVMGGVLGAAVIVGLPQVMRLIGLSNSYAGYVQLALSGLALIAVTYLWLSRSSRI